MAARASSASPTTTSRSGRKIQWSLSLAAAAGVLESLGVGMEMTRAKVLKVIEGQPLEQEAATKPQTSAQDPLLPLLPLRMLGFQDKEIRRLDGIAKQQTRTINDIVREAVRRMWLTAEGDAETPPPP